MGRDEAWGVRGAGRDGAELVTMSFDGEAAETDEALLARFADGDPSAARELTLRHTPRVLSLAASMLRDPAEAEDVAQEAMLRLWRIAPDWRAGEAMASTWLHRITSNLCIDRLRKRRRDGPPLDEVEEPTDPAPGPVARMVAADRAAAVTAAMDRLPERQRRAVRLRHFEGLGNPEIAEAMDVTVEAVESLLTRARRALAADLAAFEREAGAARKSGARE